MAGAEQARQLVRVVVVDDHAGFRKAVVDALRREHGIVVCGEAATGETALAAIALHKPDVAIVDLSLGRESGLDLVSALARTHPAVRVLVLTAYDVPDYEDWFLKAGALGFVTKDKAGRELLTAVRWVAAGKPYTSSKPADRSEANPVDPI